MAGLSDRNNVCRLKKIDTGGSDDCLSDSLCPLASACEHTIDFSARDLIQLAGRHRQRTDPGGRGGEEGGREAGREGNRGDKARFVKTRKGVTACFSSRGVLSM